MLIHEPDIYQVEKKPHLLCSKISGPCNPSCKVFDPTIACKYSSISTDYRTFAKAYWSYISEQYNTTSKWKLFYACFHPTPKKVDKGAFKADFPDDVPLVLPDAAVANAVATKGLLDDDPSKWNEARVMAAGSNDPIRQRMAATDWDWAWYSNIPTSASKVSSKQIENKVKMDKLLFTLFKDKYESEGTYTILKTNKNFLILQTIYTQLKGIIQVRLDFV